MVEIPTTIRNVCKTMPVARPNINLKAVLKPLPRLVTITNILSGPGVNASIVDASINDKTSVNDNVIFLFYRHVHQATPIMEFAFLQEF